MFFRFLLDMLIAAAIVVWLVPLAAQGYLTVQGAALAMVALVVLIAIGRAIGSGLARLAVRVGLPLASLAVFLILYGGGDPAAMRQLALPLLQLFIVLAGFYIMFGGLRRRRRRRDRD